MLKTDKAIYDVNKCICDNISKADSLDRGLISQNVLAQLRHFVEFVIIKVIFCEKEVDPYSQNINKEALKNIKGRGDLRFLSQFHAMLQKSVSHYTFDEDGSERLMLKYYEFLLNIKDYLKRTFNMEVLEKLPSFPLDTDQDLLEYYKKIADKIITPGSPSNIAKYNDRYYIRKIKPFFVNQNVFYEVTFCLANEQISKFDHAIAFTSCAINDNYASKFSIREEIINVFDKDVAILIIDDYEVSVRPCEWSNFSEIFGKRLSFNPSSKDYRNMMNFLKISKISLTELVGNDEEYYNSVKKQLTAASNSSNIFNLLDKSRKIILNNKPGANVIRYLLYKMNNQIIKSQLWETQNENLSNLFLKHECIPFEKMPFCTSLCGHNPKIYDLFESIPSDGREHELLARFIKNNAEIEKMLFTKKQDIVQFDNIDALISKYNSLLYYKHLRRKIKEFKGHLYMEGYVQNIIEIITKLKELSSTGVTQYTTSVNSWLSEGSYTIDDDEKKEKLKEMFSQSRVALIYGAAGTGKSTFINHISNFWMNNSKILLANTNSAVDNLLRRVSASNKRPYTIAKFLSDTSVNKDCDILLIDECSTINNEDFKSVLQKANFKLLILVGDVYQIESIRFGNWFSIIKDFIEPTSVFELTHPFRTNDENLIRLWDRVRKMDNSIRELLVKNSYVSKLDESIFKHEDDEIILCLNYDGLYGINNINRLLQTNNPNEPVVLGVNSYKIGDPVLFNESNAFSPLIHNNSKGKIVNIVPEIDRICFEIELDKSINEIDAASYDFKLIGVSEAGNSIISFVVNKYRNTDEDDNASFVIPFQVSYAVSIHRAQGLEYNSVKIIITQETEEQITHSIFYTAITRTKNKLKIYWSPETENAVLQSFKPRSVVRDVELLKQLKSE